MALNRKKGFRWIMNITLIQRTLRRIRIFHVWMSMKVLDVRECRKNYESMIVSEYEEELLLHVLEIKTFVLKAII